MSLYEERLTKDAAKIRSEIADLGAMVESAVRNSVNVVLSDDKKTANENILRDKPINRARLHINELCYAFIAVHMPSSRHLRQVTSILRMVNELERIGDYAVTISREAVQMPHAPTGQLRKDIEDLADLALTSLQRAMTAFNERNETLANETRTFATQGRVRVDAVFNELAGEGERHEEGIRFLFDMLIVIAQLKRVTDRAKNICEETIFIVRGEQHDRKILKILFLDKANNCYAQIAEAVARTNFPQSGEYHSAGIQDESGVKEVFCDYLEGKGYICGPARAKELKFDVNTAAAYDIVISLQGPVSDYFTEQPFRTVFLGWDMDERFASIGDAEERYLAIYRHMSAKIGDLMQILRGNEAS